MLGQGIFIAYDITYFQGAGLTLALITLASTGFDISSSIMEIPTSLFFDRVSPRVTLAVGNVIRLVRFLWLRDRYVEHSRILHHSYHS